MQNYHTSNRGPLATILAAIRDADPQHGTTVIQIARATGLDLVSVVIPALAGFIRSHIITGAPVQEQEGTSYILSQPAQPGSNTDTCEACHGSGNYLPGSTLPCVSCTGTGKIHMPPMPGPLVDDLQELEAHMTDERLIASPVSERPPCQGCQGTGSVTVHYLLGRSYQGMCLDCGGTGLAV